jgi:EAL and modified HD-GYP domain-containing signal transduction protein
MALMFARQPVFDARNRIYGYELLYREDGGTAYTCDDGDVATSNVMAASFLSMGFRELSGQKKALINFTKNMLLHGVATLFPKEQIVVEILEDVEPSEDVVAACRELKKQEYTIALDDFVFRPGYEALIEIADIIKVDFMLTRTEFERKQVVQRFRNGRIRFLAEKVETNQDFQMAVKAGYSLFQGYYFSKPVIESSKGIPPAKMNHVNLIKILQKSEPDFTEITGLIEKDVAFSYEILRIANTTHYYRGSKIVSVRQAALRMGLEELKKWALITTLRKIGGESQDMVISLCAQRAKALELLCGKLQLSGRKMEFYTLGIFSMIDVLMGCPMEQILNELSVSEEVRLVLLGQAEEGNMAACYRLVLAYEKGEWARIFEYSEKYSIPVEKISAAYFEAVVWANNFELS